MNYSLENNKLTILLPDRMTSDNTLEVRSQLMDIVDGNEFETLCLDATSLDYSSSSGLRIIIELIKKYADNLSIVNVNLEVYEVLEMTGITELTKVSKRLKQIDIEGCPVIGKGNNGVVYRYDNDSIVKVYMRPDVKLEDIEREHLLARKAFILGVPTAISFAIVKVGEYYGSMYELVGAKSILKQMYADRDNYDSYVRKYVDGMRLINSIETKPDDILIDKKAEYVEWLTDIEPYFTAEENEKIAAVVAGIPDDHTLIHGDFHMGNIMLQDGELIVIDMDTLGYGNRLFELANTHASLLGFLMLRGEDSFFDLSEEDRAKCWKLVTEYAFEDESEAQKEQLILLAETLSLIKIYRFGVRHDFTGERIDNIKKLILEGISKL